jgi:phenylacetyl-CoA:acceptor oxidoreductase subunit 1
MPTNTDEKNESVKPVDVSRRDFLRVLGAAGFTTSVALAISSPLITGGNAKASEQGSAKYHWGMVIDLSKCIGCRYCVFACQAVNDVTDDMQWNVYLMDRTETGDIFHMTRPCMHCDEPPCAEVCPTGATYKRADGLVVIDYDKCIGCRYCMVACPYEVRRFNWADHTQQAQMNKYQPQYGSPEVPRRPRGVVEKCTFCRHRIDRGLANGLTPGVHRAATPACVNICPVEARTFGDLNDPNSKVSQIIASTPTLRLREDLGTGPSVYYVPAKGMVTT